MANADRERECAMWGRGRRGGRHAAPTGAARRAASPERNPPNPSRTRDTRPGSRPSPGPGEPIAIIGGSAITLLAGRIRRRHTSADVESPTTELSLTLPTPRVEPSADRPDQPQRAVEVGRNETDPKRDRPRRRRLVTAIAVGTLVPTAALAGVLLGTRTGPEAPPPPPTVHEPSTTPPGGPPTTTHDPGRAVAYLAALRAADIPASRGGQPETEAAAAICEQSRRGVPDAELARVLPAMLTDVDRRQARTVVELARRYYCE